MHSLRTRFKDFYVFLFFLANETGSSESFVLLFVAPGALLVVIIGLAAILAIYQRHYKRSSRNQSAQSINQSLADHQNQDSGKGMSNTRIKSPPTNRPKHGRLHKTIIRTNLISVFVSSLTI